MVFTTQQANDILAANAKVSADGSINTHNDVNALNPNPGDVLAWDGTNWTSLTIGDSITQQQANDIIAANAKVSADGSINTHTDVQTSGNVTGQVLMWDGTNWVNTTRLFITQQQADDIIANNAKVSADGSINTHSDVMITLPTKNDILQWNGSQWVNSPFQTFGPGFLTLTLTPACSPMTLIPSLNPDFGSHGPGSNTTDPNRILANAWNGIPFNPCGMSSSTLYNTIVKGAYILGLEAEYNKLPPYADTNTPTFQEHMNWTIRVFNHIRKLLGNPNPVIVSQRLCNEALWRLEKAWCSTYTPNNIYSWNFLPTTQQQLNYPPTLNEWPTPQTPKNSGSNLVHYFRYEIAHATLSPTIPWWTQMSQILWNILQGHQSDDLISDIFGRPEIGIAICTVPSGFTNTAGDIAYSLVSFGTKRSYC